MIIRTLILTITGISFPFLTHSMHNTHHTGRLLFAIDTQNLQEAQEALNDGAQVNFTYQNRPSPTPLHFAVKSCYYPMVQLLLERDAHCNAQDANGMTPLHWAVEKNDTRIALLLLGTGADINAQAGEYRITPLHHAIVNDKKEMVQLLLQKGANSRLRYGTHGLTALQLAHIQTVLTKNQDIEQLLNEHESLKMLSVRNLAKLIKNGELSLEDIRQRVPYELYDLINNYLAN